MATKLKALPVPAANAAAAVPIAVAVAIKALHEGKATEYQQLIGLQWIIREAAGKANFAYHQSDRDTAFALGRQFVAEQIIGLFNADISSMRRAQDVQATDPTAK